MTTPSPTAHLYRLGFVLVALLLVFLGGVAILMPASWNFDMSYWHRADALEEMQRLPVIYGGISGLSVSGRNQACTACHRKTVSTLKKLKHKTLSCESCHGALFDHVREGRKIAAAKVDKSRWQCENCHAEQINRPRSFAQFSKTGEIGKEVGKHKSLDDATPCLKCHDAHDPTP